MNAYTLPYRYHSLGVNYTMKLNFYYLLFHYSKAFIFIDKSQNLTLYYMSETLSYCFIITYILCW